MVRWDKGFADCLCPACGRTDARLFCDGKFPVVHCFGSGCADFNAAINAELANRTKQIFGGRGFKLELTERDKAQIAYRRGLKKVEAQARNRLLPQLLRQPAVNLEQWERESPYPIAETPVEEHWRLLLSGLHKQEKTVAAHVAPGGGLLIGNDPPLVWTGHLWESGTPDYAMNFKTVVDWLALPCPYGPQVSVCTFRSSRHAGGDRHLGLKDCGSRSAEWVRAKDYFVAESDHLSREQFGLILRWVQKFTVLRAIIDTGNKSLHGWFDEPRPPLARETHRDKWELTEFYRHRDELYAILRGLGCDPNMFRRCSTARLPGVQRLDEEGQATGRWQRLVYLNPQYPIHER